VTVIPVVLERWILAGLLGFPAACLLALVALEGDAGLLLTGIIAGAAVIYVAVVALIERRSLTAAAAAAAAAPAPPDAVVEPLGRTSLRAAAKAALGLALAVLAGAVGLLPGATVIVIGFALVTALGAWRLGRLERAAGHRLVRVGGEPGRLRAF